MAEELDAETIAFAHRMFDLARSGSTGQLAGRLTHGLPANLTNDNGDTLLAAGADPAGGSPPAGETAAFFDLPEMAEPLRGR